MIKPIETYRCFLFYIKNTAYGHRIQNTFQLIFEYYIIIVPLNYLSHSVNTLLTSLGLYWYPML